MLRWRGLDAVPGGWGQSFEHGYVVTTKVSC